MSLNRSVPQPASNAANQGSLIAKVPDYNELVRFLVQPFLESSDSLSVDCEISPSTARVWVRVAFEGEDKGRVFGRGGRNIQAIRTVIAAAAELAGNSVYLDIYGSQEREETPASEELRDRVAPTRSREPRETGPKPAIKLRSRSSFE